MVKTESQSIFMNNNDSLGLEKRHISRLSSNTTQPHYPHLVKIKGQSSTEKFYLDLMQVISATFLLHV